MPATAATTQPGRRALGIAVTGCVLSGAVALFAVGRVWLHYTVPRTGLADLRATATGHTTAGAAGTLALVVLAGVVVLPATRGLGRRIAGVLIALAGVGIGYLAILTIASTTDRLDGSQASTYTEGRATAWPWIALVAGAIAIATGVFAALASGGWPAMGRRYESAGSAHRGPATETSIWDRLDEGDDPTA
ncbi:MAG TPA: Trp biosynthesis-associated membrane protein [Acidothermaceae bacterium]